MRHYAKKEPDTPERWRDVPGYEGLYQASSDGKVRRWYPRSRKWRTVKIVTGRGYGKKNHVVNLYKDGQRSQSTVLRLVALAFYPERMRGDAVAVHRNGLHSDNSLRNLLIMNKRESGLVRPDGRRRAVMKLNRDGEAVAIYPSIAAACRGTGLAKQTIYRHCEHKPTRGLPDGVSFSWDI